MNILVVCHYHYQGVSVPTALFVHAQMQALVERGHRVRVLVPVPIGKTGEDGKRIGSAIFEKTVDGIEHVFFRVLSLSNYGNRGLNDRLAVAALKMYYPRLLKGFVPDVVHGHKLGMNTELAAEISRRVGCPLVFTLHGETSCEEPWMHDTRRIATFANRADAVVCVSSALRQTVVNAGVTKPVHAIFNGFNKKNLGQPQPRGRVAINQTGYLVPSKRVHVTMQAFATLREHYPDATFEIVGDGVEKGRLMELSKRLGVASSVQFRGYVLNRQAVADMQRARFFVMPSKPEGFGIVYLEAMASGCITVGTEDQGIAEVIRHGENGFLVPADDADAIVKVITYCVEHPDEADKIAENGRQTAMQLTWEANAGRYESLFMELTERRTACRQKRNG